MAEQPLLRVLADLPDAGDPLVEHLRRTADVRLDRAPSLEHPGGYHVVLAARERGLGEAESAALAE
ncbi:MAG: hypothetical protein M3024_04445, partial [Candidatus Dormibacteraeota bacterium]|nr:hypothetical protein [Candidatus Dormibacteraeota bacterium]